MDDTIAAISTPLGEGALAVVRVSGPQALAVADAAFQPAGKSPLKPSAAPSHTIHYGHIVEAGRRVDEVLLSILRAPRTFTREDMVEVSCHGGPLPAKRVLDTLLTHGARLAAPGEFTQRAFLNGRLDLTQAEAVIDVIRSRTDLALAAAQEQLAGTLGRRIEAVRNDLLHVLAHIEAHIDFPEEDIAPDTRDGLERRMEAALQFIDGLLRTAHDGRVLRHGVRVAIVGRPNVGKSSLLNQLLGHDRAIVSPIPGTTRDTIEETASIRGLPVVFVDTAGLRESGDVLEREGIRRSREALTRAELILHILDGTEALGEEDRRLLEEFSRRPRLLVRNKSDQPLYPEFPVLDPAPLPVSCLSGEGLEALKDHIRERVWSGGLTAEMAEVTINSRHQDALRRAQTAAEESLQALRADLSLEFVALDLRIAINAVGEVVGKTITEDLLDSIFGQFCIGK